MARLSRGSAFALTLLLSLAASGRAQQSLTGLPTLNTGTTTTTGTGTDGTSQPAATTTSDHTGDHTNTKTNANTQTTPAATTVTGGSTSSAASSTSFVTTGTESVTNAPTLSGTGASTPFHLSSVPTIAGVGIPTMVVPYTANAPFMQKSKLPQGTVFIAVGAVLAFLGACVLLWRGLVAWSINHSVKKAALASVRGGAAGGNGGEKDTRHWRTPGYHAVPTTKSALYKDEYGGSSMSLEPLTSSGKPLKPYFRESVIEARSATPPANLFFSPTAQAQQSGGNRESTFNPGNRASAYMPAGYYASPSAQPAGGAATTTMGGYTARHSAVYPSGPSPPESPEHSASLAPRATQRNTSRDGRRPGASARNSYFDSTTAGGAGTRSGAGAGAGAGRTSAVYAQPSSSSLAVGATTSSEALAGSRAPSAYLEDLFDNHGSGPRDRF